MTASFDATIREAVAGRLTDSDIAHLANGLGRSGQVIEGCNRSSDVASTGGPGSLSTLWGPPALVAAGKIVPKLGVPGRPAGGIDVLGQLPGYQVDPPLDVVRTILDACGYVHVLAGERFAPADAQLFTYRQQVGAQAVPALAIASLLAKKIAMGVRNVLLEVRVAYHGNFGVSMDEARRSADRFCQVALLLGIDAVCVLTDGSKPQQPFIGRGEALLAISLLLNEAAPDWLERHAQHCEAWASEITAKAESPILRESVSRAFLANVIAQGADASALHSRAAQVSSEHDKHILASRAGCLNYDLGALRNVIIAFRSVDERPHFGDDLGVILLREPGSCVALGEPIISVRCPEHSWSQVRHALADTFFIEKNDHNERAALPASSLWEIVRV